MNKKFKLHKEEINTLVCQSFSDCYHDLNQYILTEGIKTDSRLGATYETLNFKIVIQKPIHRCTISFNRNSNIFFHLAESLWVLSGRNDLGFIEIFNSRFLEFSDDGKTLHGAYGKRMREWNNTIGSETIDQLYKITSLLNVDPNLRRSVISLWNPSLDLGNTSKDIPCNTQLVLRVKGDDFYFTIFNRSNDLHWGYVANIFQFSFLGEIISLLLNKKYARQTHFSQSLHIYAKNNLIHEVIESDINNNFYTRYKPVDFTFNFENSTEKFKERFAELDVVLKKVTEIVLGVYKSKVINFSDLDKLIEPIRSKSKSFYEIAYLLVLFVNYKKDLKTTANKNELRMKYANYLIEKGRLVKFEHEDYFALGLNYFVQRMEDYSKLNYTKKDSQMGQY